MRKAFLFLILCFVVTLAPLSSRIVMHTQIGPELMILDESSFILGESIAVNERSTLISFDSDLLFTGDDEKFGFSLGIAASCPVKMEVNGIDLATDFSDSLFSYSAGLYASEKLQDSRFFSTIGYRFGYIRDTEYVDGYPMTTIAHIHMIDGKAGFEMSADESTTLSFGLRASYPFYLYNRAEYLGEVLEPEIRVSGISLNPFIGIVNRF